jgi:hypothetical protein
MAFYPERGYLIITQHFNAGSWAKTEKLVPPGTVEGVFCRPWRDLVAKMIAIPSAGLFSFVTRDGD